MFVLVFSKKNAPGVTRTHGTWIRNLFSVRKYAMILYTCLCNAFRIATCRPLVLLHRFLGLQEKLQEFFALQSIIQQYLSRPVAQTR